MEVGIASLLVSVLLTVAKMTWNLKTRHKSTFLRLYVSLNCHNCQWDPYNDYKLSFFPFSWTFNWWCFSGELTSSFVYPHVFMICHHHNTSVKFCMSFNHLSANEHKVSSFGSHLSESPGQHFQSGMWSPTSYLNEERLKSSNLFVNANLLKIGS